MGRIRSAPRSRRQRAPAQIAQIAEATDALIDRGFLAGVPLADADGRALAVAVTEKRSRGEIDRFAHAFAEVLA